MLTHYGAVAGLRVARKHLGWYARGFPGAAEFRARIMTLADPAQVVTALRTAWAQMREQSSPRAAAA